MHESKYRGTIKGIHYDYSDESLAGLEIEPTNYPRKKKKKGEPESMPMSRQETVSMEMAAKCHLGDEVDVVTTVTKTRKGGYRSVR